MREETPNALKADKQNRTLKYNDKDAQAAFPPFYSLLRSFLICKRKIIIEKVLFYCPWKSLKFFPTPKTNVLLEYMGVRSVFFLHNVRWLSVRESAGEWLNVSVARMTHVLLFWSDTCLKPWVTECIIFRRYVV